MSECRTLAEELPFAIVLTTEASQNHCSFCLKNYQLQPELLKTCPKCRFAHYCDRICQKNAWTDHKEECAYLSKCTPQVPRAITRLIARVIRKLENTKQLEKEEKSWSGRTFDDLINHNDEMIQDDIRMSRFTATQMELSGLCGIHLDDKRALELFGAVEINCIDIGTFHSRNLAVGLYLSLSSLDHSCDPDAWVVNDGPKAILRTNQANVVLNRSVKIMYTRPAAMSVERKQFLQSHYYFNCVCRRCLDSKWDLLLRSVRCPRCHQAAIIEHTDSSMAACQNAICSHQFDATPAILLMSEFDAKNTASDEKFLSNLENDDWYLEKFKETETLLSNVNLYCYKTMEKVRISCDQKEDWSRSVEFAKKGLQLHMTYAQNAETMLSDHWMLIWELSSRLPLSDHLEITKKALIQHKRSHGENHSLIKEFNTRLEDLQFAKMLKINES